jgi:PAS domain S-box-containing protein
MLFVSEQSSPEDILFRPEQYCSTFTEFSRDLAEQVEVAQDGFVLLDQEYRFRYLNQMAERLLKKPRTELLGKSIWDEYPGHVGTELERQIRRVMHERTLVRCENYDVGLQTWFEFQINPLSRQGIAMWLCDITDRKRLQQRAEHSAATLDALMENVPEGLTITNASTGLIELVSKYSLNVINRTLEDLVCIPIESYGEKWHILRPDGSSPEPQELPAVRATEGETIYCEEWLIERTDGTRISVLYNAAPVLDRQGKILGSVLVWRDISERKAEQARRAESQKVAMAATLAGGVAHQLNNSLTAVIGNISLAHDEPDLSSKSRRSLETSLDAAQHAVELVGKLLAFVGKSVVNAREEVDLAEQIRNFEGVMRAMVPRQIRLEFDLAADAPHVRADPEQIRGALTALLANAIEAIADGGAIVVKTRVQELTKRKLQGLRNGSKLKSGTYVSIEVSDTGAGIRPEHRDQIFDPFFSTKFLGRGLGLAAVEGTVKSHNGALGVTTEVGRGTEFRLYLPVG